MRGTTPVTTPLTSYVAAGHFKTAFVVVFSGTLVGQQVFQMRRGAVVFCGVVLTACTVPLFGALPVAATFLDERFQRGAGLRCRWILAVICSSVRIGAFGVVIVKAAPGVGVGGDGKGRNGHERGQDIGHSDHGGGERKWVRSVRSVQL